MSVRVCPTDESISLRLCALPGPHFAGESDLQHFDATARAHTPNLPETSELVLIALVRHHNILFDNTLAAALSSIYPQDFVSRNDMPPLIRNSRRFFGHTSGHIPLFETKHSTASETP
jgi:hypothetical protein